MASISLRNLTKTFGDTLAVDNVSLDIGDNEFFCLFGPPLCGKTTILKLILGLERPDCGQVLIDGEPVNDIAPAARNIAMVFQNLALFPHMSARDNLRFPLVERGVAESAIAAKVEDVAVKLHIGHILHKPPAQLSGGERQRVAIARALVRDPVAYLMDDPISALDARLREETRVELKRIQRELGHTLIYVTHDQEEAMSIADRMAVMQDGQVRQVGTPIEIYDDPNSVYVAGLLGAPAINIFDADGEDAMAGGAIRLTGAAPPDDAARIGVRPEDLLVTPWSEGDSPPARVYEVEPLGGFTVVTLEAGPNRLRAMQRGQPTIEADAKVALSADAARAHYFSSGGAALVRRAS